MMRQKNDKAGQETWIIGGGAYHASDKIVQHNGCGTVNVSDDSLSLSNQCSRS